MKPREKTSTNPFHASRPPVKSGGGEPAVKAPSAPKSQSQPPSADSVSARAYQLWEQNGRPHGDDQSHWFAAEQELRAGSPAGPDTSRERGALLPPPGGEDFER